MTQYAVFAAYHLSLETSFLVDEGASLPKAATKSSTEKMPLDKAISVVPDSATTTSYAEVNKVSDIDLGSADLTLELGLQESLSELGDTGCDDVSIPDEFRFRKALSEACNENLALDVAPDDLRPTCLSVGQEEGQSGVVGLATPIHGEDTEASGEYFSAHDSHHNILVSFSSHNMANGTVCERSRLVRLKFYGNSDKPLGRYLRDDLFDQVTSAVISFLFCFDGDLSSQLFLYLTAFRISSHFYVDHARNQLNPMSCVILTSMPILR